MFGFGKKTKDNLAAGLNRANGRTDVLEAVGAACALVAAADGDISDDEVEATVKAVTSNESLRKAFDAKLIEGVINRALERAKGGRVGQMGLKKELRADVGARRGRVRRRDRRQGEGRPHQHRQGAWPQAGELHLMGTRPDQSVPFGGPDVSLIGRIRSIGMEKIGAISMVSAIVLTFVQVLTGGLMDWVASFLILGILAFYIRIAK